MVMGFVVELIWTGSRFLVHLHLIFNLRKIRFYFSSNSTNLTDFQSRFQTKRNRCEHARNEDLWKHLLNPDNRSRNRSPPLLQFLKVCLNYLGFSSALFEQLNNYLANITTMRLSRSFFYSSEGDATRSFPFLFFNNCQLPIDLDEAEVVPPVEQPRQMATKSVSARNRTKVNQKQILDLDAIDSPSTSSCNSSANSSGIIWYFFSLVSLVEINFSFYMK